MREKRTKKIAGSWGGSRGNRKEVDLKEVGSVIREHGGCGVVREDLVAMVEDGTHKGAP